jgi:hypothetical protein
MKGFIIDYGFVKIFVENEYQIEQTKNELEGFYGIQEATKITVIEYSETSEEIIEY